MERRYPNPAAVAYPSTQPPKFPCQLTSRNAGRMYPIHNHSAFLDREGNGNTDVDAGHFHRVRGFRVLPDPSDGHTHELTMLPCGDGAPWPTGREGPLQLGAAGDVHATQPGEVAPRAIDTSMGRVPILPLILGGLVAAGVIAGGVYLMCQDER